MKRKTAKIIVWFLIIIFVGITLLGIVAQIMAGINSQNVAYAAETSYRFTLEEAIAYAKQNNYDMAALKLQSSGLTYSLSENRGRVNDYEDQVDFYASIGQSIPSSFEQYLLKSNYYGYTIKVNEEILKLTQSVQEEMLDLFVESAYNTVLISKIKLEDAQRNSELVKKQLETAQIKYNLGNISEIEFKSLELEANSAEIELLNAEKEYDDAKIEFNQKLGLGIEVEVELTTPLVMTQKEIVESEEKEELIKNKSITLLSAEKKLDTAKEYQRYAKAYYGNTNSTARNAGVSVKTAELEFEEAKIDIEKAIKSTYKNIEIMKKTLELMDKRVKLMESLLGLTNIRKNAGMATENDVIQASLNYSNSRNEYYELLNSYNIMVGMFDKNIVN